MYSFENNLHTGVFIGSAYHGLSRVKIEYILPMICEFDSNMISYIILLDCVQSGAGACHGVNDFSFDLSIARKAGHI